MLALAAMSGEGGRDVLRGGEGNDTMAGGTGGDFFVFNVAIATGVDMITDFEVNIDHIRLDNSGFADFNAVLAATTQDGVDTVIDLGAGDTIRLQNVGVNALDAGDFIIL